MNMFCAFFAHSALLVLGIVGIPASGISAADVFTLGKRIRSRHNLQKIGAL